MSELKRITMDEAARELGICAFCGMLGPIRCDGDLGLGRRCGAALCSSHAFARAHVRSSKGCDGRHLCPLCVANKRRVLL